MPKLTNFPAVMKLSSRSAATSLEPLESRIAPAVIRIGAVGTGNENDTDTEYNESGSRPDLFDDLSFVNVASSNDLISLALKAPGTANAYYLRLEAGDQIFRFTEGSNYQELVRVNSGSAIIYFTDDVRFGNEYFEGELTGISLSKNASIEINGTVHGDIVTNLNTHGTADPTDDTLDMSGLVGPKQGIKLLSVPGGGVEGNVLSGGSIKSILVQGDVQNVLVGEAAHGIAFDFFDVVGGEGIVNFTPAAGEKGGSISNVRILSVTGQIAAGDGGFGAAGGSLKNIQITADPNGFSIIAGDGGDGNSIAGKLGGGAGGKISSLFVAGIPDLTPNSNVLVKTGDGGDGTTTGKGGKGGSMKTIRYGFEVSGGSQNPSGDLLKDNLRLEGGAGGSGQVGGTGGALSDIRVRTSTPDQLGGGDEISLVGGVGGNSVTGGGKAGAGGKIVNAEVRNQVQTFNTDTIIQGGDAGFTVAGSRGANGGSISNLTLLGYDLQIVGGDGSDGTVGGKGGNLSAVNLVQDDQILAQNVLLNAGRGGNGSSGNGGSGGNMDSIKVFSSDFEVFLVNPATGANGGNSSGGKGGKGGNVTGFTVTDIDIGQNRSGTLDARAGRGGDGELGGGKGGSLTRFSAETDDVNVTLAASDGGNATTSGAGGRGGGMSIVQLQASGTAFGSPLTGQMIAGDGGIGTGAGKAGGRGGDVKNSNLVIEGSGSIVAGDGGSGQAPLPGTAGGAAGSGGSLLSAGVFASTGSVSLLAGDAGTVGAKPGNGGSITGSPNSLVILRGSTDLIARGGNGSFGGSGGTISNLSFGSANVDDGPDGDPLTPTPIGSILIQAGTGSQGPTKAGKGGSVLNVNGAASSGDNESLQILAGDGGGDTGLPTDSGKSAAGGSIANISLSRGGALNGLIVFEAGDAGDSSNAGKGAAGGSISRVAINDVAASTLIRSFGAGDGGNAAGRGGNGGSITDIQVLGHDIGVRTGQYFGYTSMGGLFAGTAGTGATPGVAGSVVNISADAIASIVAGKTNTPQLANRISDITLNDDNQILFRNNSFVKNNTFTLTFNGQTTNEIPGNATAAQLEAALNLLPGIGSAGGVTVSSFTSEGGYMIEFGGTQEARTDSTLTAPELEAALESLPTILNSGTPPGVTVTTEPGGLRVTVNSDGTNALVPNGASVDDIAAALNSTSFSALGDFFVRQETTGGFPGDYIISFDAKGFGDQPQIIGTENVPVDVIQKIRGAVIDLSATESRNGEVPLDVTETRSGSDPLTFVETVRGELNFTASVLAQGDPDLPASEVQSISLTAVNGFPTAQFALSFDVDETPLISAAGLDTAIAANIDAALEALPSIQALGGTAGNQVSVTASPTTPRTFVVAFDVLSGDVSTITGRFVVPEVQRYTLDPALPGIAGSAYQIDYEGQTTAPIPANATAAQVDAALEALTTIQALGGPANDHVTVTSPAPGFFDITFNSNGDKTPFTGFTLVPEVQQLNVSALAAQSDGTFRLTFDGPNTLVNETTVALPATASALDIQNALNQLDSVKATNAANTGSVVVSPAVGGLFTITFAENGEQNLIVGTGFIHEIQNLDLTSVATAPGAEFTVTVQTALPIFESSQFIVNPLKVTVAQQGQITLPTANTVQGTATVSEVDTVDRTALVPFAAAGSLQFMYLGEPTALLPGNATAAQIETELDALGSISNVGGVTVTLVGNQIRISFDTAGDQFDSIVGFGIVPEQQIIDFGNPPKFPAGFSILEYQGERTAPPNPNTPLPPSPTPAEVDAALDQLSTIAAVGGVTVTAVAGQPGQMRVTFDVAGDVPDAITGINYNPEAQVIDLNPIVGTNATLTLSFNGESTGALSENSTAAEIDAALDALVTIMAVNGVSVAETAPGTRIFNVFFNVDADVPMIQGGVKLPSTDPATIPPGTTPRLPGNSTAAQIEAAMDAVTMGGVTVTPGAVAGTFDVLFGNLGDQPLITFTTYLHEVQTVDVYDVGQFFIRSGAEQTPLLNPPIVVADPFNITPAEQAQLDASALALQDALNALPSINPIPGNARSGVHVVANVDTSFDVIYNADGDQASVAGVQPEPMDTSTKTQGSATTSEEQIINYFPKNELDPVAYSFANFVGAIADLNEHNANRFHFVDLDSSGTFTVGDRPLDGIVMARTIDQATLNFTPEARLSLNGFFDNDNFL